MKALWSSNTWSVSSTQGCLWDKGKSMPSGRAIQFFILIVCLFSWEEPESLQESWRQVPAFTWETLLLCEVVLGKGGKGSRKFHAYKHCQKQWRLWWRIIKKRLVALTQAGSTNTRKMSEQSQVYWRETRERQPVRALLESSTIVKVRKTVCIC